MTATDDGTLAPGVVLAEPVRRARTTAARGAAPTPTGRSRRHRRWPWIVAGVVLLALGAGTWFAVQRINAPLAPAVPHPGTDAAIVVPGPAPGAAVAVEGPGGGVRPGDRLQRPVRAPSRPCRWRP